MPRSRSRSRSRSYSPRGREARRDTGGPRKDPGKTSLLFRNLSKTTTADDLRHYAERYGPLRDIYLPRDFHSGWDGEAGRLPRGRLSFTRGRGMASRAA
ncbi:Serine/arginine-rich splicing factor 33 [Tetrabaena socialis]|uniref:Serine/arginine-rich splicing factor 33 n=1 Tax=Tetrabaena socialis TaxID=47790 RepID=A0A2J7X5S5_9CHLO|nr:Serine/arginine-rich splicing factor 33 [Tetrabaena socialis]|eukprot:PNG71108.1 Serine/arginine-rich splicing factor 33 [Tetrabaena socialis]